MILTVTLNAAIDKTYWIPGFSLGGTNRVLKQAAEPGGKGVNVAKVLSSLGKEVNVTGFVGGDTGKELQRLLGGFNIGQRWFEIDGETRTCLNIIDEESNRETEILEQGIEVSREEWANFLSGFKTLVSECEMVLISGSLPAGLEHGSYRDLVEVIKAQGKTVGLDTSGLAFKEGLKSKPSFIKPNIAELNEFCGKVLKDEDEIIHEAVKLYKSGINHVFVSLGKEGAIGVSCEGVFRAKLPPIIPLNTVGSGDATFAGIGYNLARNGNTEQCLRSGMAAGMANALQQRAGRIDLDDYMVFAASVETQKLAEVRS
ncbi:1-phosphofructokinase family hexose kinase [Bacillus sp. EB01]|uniref:1-phosphofructokinase family hexose kinase n=1 Tax=Bacillus sp. EB01 TaxID=1347086 RepID=UPI0005C48583|nr:1-phosphofructokinase family hexose kinase [Bacillus sp. EB01]